MSTRVAEMHLKQRGICNSEFQIDQKKANIAQISHLRGIFELFAVSFLFIIIKIKKISPEAKL